MTYDPQKSDNPNKQLIRQCIVESLSTIEDKHKRILTLPNLNFELEQEAIKLGYKVNTVEVKREVFNQQKLLRDKLGISPIDLSLNNECVSLFLRRNPTRHFSLAYLDFCGSFSKEINLTLHDISDRCGIIFATFLFSRENINHHRRFTSGDRVFDYVQIFNEHGYSIERVFRYQNGVSPMCTFKFVKIQVPVYKQTKLKKKKPQKSKVVKYGMFSNNFALINKPLIVKGFDYTRPYLFSFIKESNELVLKEDLFGGSFSKNGSQVLKNLWKFSKENNLFDKKFDIYSVEQDTENKSWKFKLTERV